MQRAATAAVRPSFGTDVAGCDAVAAALAPACVHHWRIEPLAVEGAFPARCKHCSAARGFTAVPSIAWSEYARMTVILEGRDTP